MASRPFIYNRTMSFPRSLPHKAVILGDTNVGKTALIHVREIGEIGERVATIQPSEVIYTESVDAENVTVALWDTPGQYTFRNMVKNFLRDSECIVLVYDVTNWDTFYNLDEWIKFVQDTIDVHSLVVVANKIDLPNREIDRATGNKWAVEHGGMYVETSALTKEGVDDLFNQIARKAMETAPRRKDTIIVAGSSNKEKKKCC